jgi:poly(beta-D-mannuronate) lyase
LGIYNVPEDRRRGWQAMTTIPTQIVAAERFIAKRAEKQLLNTSVSLLKRRVRLATSSPVPSIVATNKDPTMTRLVPALIFFALPGTLLAADVPVDSLPALNEAIAGARPGDHVILADGQYDSSGTIEVAVVGTPDEPIVIRAETVGGVEIAGEAGFRLVQPAAYVVIQGFVFTHEAGEMELGEGVHHCRVTRNVFELAVDDDDRARYLSVVGDDNEIDHNEFRNKDTEGQMVQVHGPGDRAMAQRTWIHHNYFHDFRNSRQNNSSALHIGHSGRSMTSAWSVVEHNLFVRTEGENEGSVCNKATDNVYRFNTFGEDSTELSLRHGKRCLVYGNFFLGGNGIRFFSHDHRIYSNYFEGCRPAIAIGNGGATIPPGELTSHERPDRVHVVFNTFVNNRTNVRMSGRRRGLGANDLVFANNVIVGGDEAVEIDGPLANPTWAGNIVWDNNGGAGDVPDGGFSEVDPGLAAGDSGRFAIGEGSPAIGAGVGDYAYVTIDVDGQPRDENLDAGADQFSAEPITNRPLEETDVGPAAPDEERPWISAPQLAVEWIPAADAR